MAVVPEEEIQRLVRVYRRAAKDLAREFVARVSIDDARVLLLVREALRILHGLDEETARWASRNLRGAYNQSRKDTIANILALGLSRRTVGAAGDFATINEQTLDALMTAPSVGLLSSLRAATDQIRNRLRLIRSQVRLLRARDETINDAIARVDLVRGRTVGEIKRQIVSELSAGKAAASALKSKATALGPGNIFANLANLPFVTLPSGNGERHLRLDDFAGIAIQTKIRQAVTLGQRNALLEHGQTYVTISRNLSKDDDACNLYIGRVFALTDEAAEALGVPHVDLLPNGGTPFHPNCTHLEEPFFMDSVSKGVLRRATTSPPSWALGKSWKEVQKEYEARGGNAFGHEQNPNLRQAMPPRVRQKATR